MGAFGEGSQDLHSLVQILAESKVASMGLARGRCGTESELGVVVGQVRRMISTVSVRAQVQCLLSRVNLIGGEGVDRASKRRQWVAIEEERMRCERIAQWIGRVRGQNIVRRGEFLID